MALQVVLGRSNVTTAYHIAASQRAPRSVVIQKALCAPFEPYFGIRNTPPQPIDYAVLRLLQEGLMMSFADRPRAVPIITRRVGLHWWWGSTIGVLSNDRESLYSVLGTQLEKQFDTLIQSSPVEQVLWGSSTQFIKMMQDKSHIDCTTQQVNNKFNIFIHHCPFCQMQAPTCRVFFGVVEAYFAWLQHRASTPLPQWTARIIETERPIHHIEVAFV